MGPCRLHTPGVMFSWPLRVTEHSSTPAFPGVWQWQEASHNTELMAPGCRNLLSLSSDLSAHHQLGAQGWGHTEKDTLLPSSPWAPKEAGGPLTAQRPFGVLRSGLGCLLTRKGVQAPLWSNEGLFPQLTDKCGVFLSH